MKSVLITGCASGFGRLTAMALARRGDRVCATVRDPGTPEAVSLAKIAADEGLDLEVRRLDVTDDDSVRTAVAAAGPIDALVNNAGYVLRGPVTALSDDELRAQFDTNVFGVVRVIRAVAPGMRERGAGTIVNVSSVAALAGAPYEGAYCATKHALDALSEALRFELGPYGVRVVLVAPGSFGTEILAKTRWAAAFGPDHPERPAHDAFWEAYASAHAGGRGDPQQVADAIVAAIDDPAAEFRRLVGADARFVHDLRRARTQEEFEREIGAALALPGLAS
ncbi:NAD(P)-dependent dehydrogenase (short-subunit alcohol dehydrogenase family) [Thermocatellispora tengchongensis]|uniref:NAD(P)-dependent dehydrogenase (Short-subunit alcohol dehydrogenase family) n=1 Tax=Thermocatellispora tengchongensis TaxID=1073253 RepID=A0A840PPU7_9ACTN|nr:SDR family oxidoreductase [Thermocatellispora tengchongensis]MBB5139760.1 NAD(P)-dependent dehydrogenase (short-subunit alcohol dehydrogenase family) [Thermocatellispora tengchongensis]